MSEKHRLPTCVATLGSPLDSGKTPRNKLPTRLHFTLLPGEIQHSSNSMQKACHCLPGPRLFRKFPSEVFGETSCQGAR